MFDDIRPYLRAYYVYKKKTLAEKRYQKWMARRLSVTVPQYQKIVNTERKHGHR